MTAPAPQPIRADVASMTGFARVDGAAGESRWAWEVKSVNARGLEMRFRLPPGRDSLEPALRARAADRLSRGAVSASLTLERAVADARLRLNEANLAAALQAAGEVAARIQCDPPRPEGLLALRGVLELDESVGDEAAREAADAAIVADFERALAALQSARRAEGARLGAALAEQLTDLTQLTEQARARADAVPALFRERLQRQIQEALADTAAGETLSDERIAAEVAVLAVKADVREELDRLSAHLDAARALLADGEAVGRRLDFLTQELNREANTLCAKAPDLALKQIGLEMKTRVDQIREQAQNIE